MSKLPANVIRHDHGFIERCIGEDREAEVKIGTNDKLADGRPEEIQDHRVGHRDSRVANQPDSIGPAQRRCCEVRGLRRIIGAQVSDASIFKSFFDVEKLRF